jgi:hypothetical protein
MNSHPLENTIPYLRNHVTIEKHMQSIFHINGTKHAASIKMASDNTFSKQCIFGGQFIKHQPPPKDTNF